MTREEIEGLIREDIRNLQAKITELDADLPLIEKIEEKLKIMKIKLKGENEDKKVLGIKDNLENCLEKLNLGLKTDGKSVDGEKIQEKIDLVIGYISDIENIIEQVTSIKNNIKLERETNVNQITTNSAYLTNHIIPEKYEPYHINPYVN